MKYYTVVNEVKALQRAYAVCACVFCARMRLCVLSACVCVCALPREWGFVCQEVAVIMPPSRSEVFQGIMSLHVRERAVRERGEVSEGYGGYSEGNPHHQAVLQEPINVSVDARQINNKLYVVCCGIQHSFSSALRRAATDFSINLNWERTASPRGAVLQHSSAWQ